MDEASRYLAELAHQSLREINDTVKGHRDFLRCLIEEVEAEVAAILVSTQQQQQVGATHSMVTEHAQLVPADTQPGTTAATRECSKKCQLVATQASAALLRLCCSQSLSSH
jgi:hypothetical protein